MIQRSPEINSMSALKPELVFVFEYSIAEDKIMLENLLSKTIPEMLGKIGYVMCGMATEKILPELSINDNISKMSRSYKGWEEIKQLCESYSFDEIVMGLFVD